VFSCAIVSTTKKVKFSFHLSFPVFATTALARDDLKPLAVLYKNQENRLMSFYKNQENPCCDARAAPYVSSPVPACSEASFGMPTPEKKRLRSSGLHHSKENLKNMRYHSHSERWSAGSRPAMHIIPLIHTGGIVGFKGFLCVSAKIRRRRI